MGPAEVSAILTLLLGTSPDGSRAPFASADGAARAAACAAEVCRQHGRPTAGGKKMPSALPEDGAPSASLDHLKAQAAPT